MDRRTGLYLLVGAILVGSSLHRNPVNSPMRNVAAPAFAFHHTALPVETCAADANAGNNPTAKEALREQGQFPPRLPPVGTAGQEHTENTPAEQQCASPWQP